MRVDGARQIDARMGRLLGVALALDILKLVAVWAMVFKPGA